MYIYIYICIWPGHPRELGAPLSLVNSARGNANFCTGRVPPCSTVEKRSTPFYIYLLLLTTLLFLANFIRFIK